MHFFEYYIYRDLLFYLKLLRAIFYFKIENKNKSSPPIKFFLLLFDLNKFIIIRFKKVLVNLCIDKMKYLKVSMLLMNF